MWWISREGRTGRNPANPVNVMKEPLQRIARCLLIAPALPGLLHGVELINTDFVYATPETFVAQPDLDGDGVADLVVIERASGIIRAALADRDINWLEPVPGGVSAVSGVAAGNFEAPSHDSLALVAPATNRIHVFSYAGDTLNRIPRPVHNAIWGLGELAAIEENNSGTPATVELVGLSTLHNPDYPGIRDFLSYNGSTMESYDPGFARATTVERDYRNMLAEAGLPLLGCFRETSDPLVDLFALVDTIGGSFDTLEEVPVAHGAEVIHASFDKSGGFQFVFHVPGSDTFECHAWNGGGLDPVATFTLSAPAQRLFPYVSSRLTGIFAVSMDGLTARFHSFNGFDIPQDSGIITPTSGQQVSLVLPQTDESIIILSGPSGEDPTAHAERFGFDGSFFSPIASYPPPSLQHLVPGSNVLLFSQQPFIHDNATLTGRLGAGVWTSAVALGGSIEVLAESYAGETGGLGDPSPVLLGSTPAGTTDALVNQVESDIALYDRTVAVGAVAGSVTASPGPGSYAESITVELRPSDPAINVLYRILPDGNWINGTGPIGPRFEDFSLQFFGITSGDERTPIFTAAYTISVPPSGLDSDKDGVPDYVEIDAGLDPVNSGDDGDGDGFNDLLELLAGTDPADDTSMPPSRELDSDGDTFSDLEEALAGTSPTDPLDFPAGSAVLNFQTVFDLIAVPYSHDGVADLRTPSLDEGLEIPGGESLATTVRLYDPAASLIGVDRTALHGLGGVTDPSAYINEVAVDHPDLFQVVSTERTFNIDVAAADRRRGRQLAAIVPIPEVVLPPVPYAYGGAGGNLGAEAAAWTAAARAHFLSLPRPQVVRDVDVLDTLVLMLVELKVENILTYRGILSGDPLTLTGYRANETPVELSAAPGDGSRRVLVPNATLASLRHKFDATDTGYLPKHVFAVVDELVQAGLDARVAALASVAAEIFRISAATADDTPGSLLPPLDALRQFVRTGSLLHTGYLSDPETAPLDSATMVLAYSAVPYILSQEMARPMEFRVLRITGSGSGSGCTVLEDTTSFASVSLVDFRGNPYALPDAFQIPTGTEIHVQGYADVSSDCLAAHTIEVIPPVQVVYLPVASSSDNNQNLIPDQVEELYPVGLNTFGDSDADGYTDLQETLDGTDPTNPAKHQSGPPVDLSPPVISISESGGSTFSLHFDFPADYADSLTFRLFSGADLDTMALDTGFDAVHTGAGQFQLTIQKPLTYPVFYRFRMQLP